MPIAAEWAEGVHYRGDVVTWGGSTYQAVRDTAKEPPALDWRPLALAGRDGASGEVRGLYDPEATYARLDRVAFDGCEWIAVKDDPGPLPGEGWRMGAQRGQRGKPGPQGDPGPPGPAGPGIKAASIEGYAIRLRLTDGAALELDLRSMFERYDAERAA